jgi:hypothetical protein
MTIGFILSLVANLILSAPRPLLAAWQPARRSAM